jgi:hypothetical protein
MSPSTRGFFWAWSVSFATLIGIAAGVVALLPHIEFTIARSVWIFIACMSASFVYAWRGHIKPHLPIDDIEPLPLCRLQCPTNRILMQQAHNLAADSYGRVEPINLERYEQWRLKNPNVLVCLVDENEMVVGYFDVFPITSSFAEALTTGLASEHEMLHEHILAPDHLDDCKWLYLGGIAVKDPDTYLARRRAAYLVWGLKKYLRDFYKSPPDRTLIATGASKEGERLLQRFHFGLLQPKNLRADKQNLYATSLSNKALLNALAGIPDWRNSCRISWRSKALRER